MAELITILGPTASGKTSLAARLAYQIGGEIISADSRQVYRGMNIGTGKDLEEYHVNETEVPFHLIDIAEPGEEYNIFRFRKDFHKAFEEIVSRDHIPILCGGSGMYLSSVLQEYQLFEADAHPEEMAFLEQKSNDELVAMLNAEKVPHNTTDLLDRKRLLRAVYIARSGKELVPLPNISKKYLFGILFNREEIRMRITNRLDFRLQNGMIEEVKSLLDSGVTPEQLKFYGLEYRFITQFVLQEISYTEMFRGLNIAIHQFAKRQMTWFRHMEKTGCKIHWIDGNLSIEDKVRMIMNYGG